MLPHWVITSHTHWYDTPVGHTIVVLDEWMVVNVNVGLYKYDGASLHI